MIIYVMHVPHDVMYDVPYLYPCDIALPYAYQWHIYWGMCHAVTPWMWVCMRCHI